MRFRIVRLIRRMAAALGMLALLAGVSGRLASAAEPFFFIQLSDPQLGMFTKNEDFTQETANLEFAVATINRLKPAFVVVTGDLINRPADPDQLAEYQRIIGQVAHETPVYQVAGNHDVGAAPTPITVAAWKNHFGEDHYSFRHGGFAGVILNSSLIYAPDKARGLFTAQEQWLRAELPKLRAAGATQIVVFQHHPWFLKSPDEPDQYFNIPLSRRRDYLQIFHDAKIRYLVCGHLHRNALATDGDLEVITTGPVGKPLGDGKSGLRIFIVREDGIEHRFYDFGELPSRVELTLPPPK
jgi:3',5'-cyclic AMP phosphodiesterase CpdA